jgi:spermidine synthase
MKNRAKTAAHSVDISEAAGIRYLHFGSEWVQGAMRIARPWSLELVYTREMMAGLLLQQAANWPRHVLQIGLGAGSLSKYMYRHLPQCRMTVVEINPQVEFIARQYFNLPDDPMRLDVRIEDGADYMLRGERQFDYILLDGFDADAKAGALDTLPFYQACRAHLSDKGLLAVNLLGKNKGFQASVERIREAFDQRVLVFPSCDSGNTIAFACAGQVLETTLGEMRNQAEKIKQDSGLDLLPTITRLQLSNAFPDGRLSL